MSWLRRVKRMHVAPRGAITLTERPEAGDFHLTFKDLHSGQNVCLVMPYCVWGPVGATLKAAKDRLVRANEERTAREVASMERLKPSIDRINNKIAVRTLLKNSTPKAEARDYNLMRLRTSPGESGPGPAERAFALADAIALGDELARMQGFEL